MQAIRTMQDLLNNLENLGYSDSTITQIRPRIKESAKIYNAPLNRIPADHAKFEADWGRGRVAALAKGFRNHEHFVEWRKRVGGALSRAAGPKLPKQLLPEWQALSEYCRENCGTEKLSGPHREAGIEAVGEVASATGLRPIDLDAGWVTPAARPLKHGARRTFKGGITTLSLLVAARERHPEIANNLPLLSLPQPDRVKSPPSPWRRGHRPQSAQLWSDFDAFVFKKRGVDAYGNPIAAKDSEFKTTTEKVYRTALNQATAMLERAGDLDASKTPRLADICNPATIARIANLWQTRALQGDVRKDATTRKNIVARLTHLAAFAGKLSKKERKALDKVSKQVRMTSPKSDVMSPPRLAWIKAFDKSPAQQRAVHTGPEKLQAKSTAILNHWDDLKTRKRHKQRMHALSLGVAAVQNAILFRGSSVRASNLRGLPFRGPDAQLFLETETGDVELSIPAHLVKNGVIIEAEFDDDARQIIEWYLKEIRPRLIEDHPYGVKLVDSDYLFPSMSSDRPMEETTFASHYARGVEAIGLDMTLHQARHITGYFILSVDPSAIGLVAAVLCNSIAVAMAHYAWMDGVKASREGRVLLRQARAEARKNHKGKKQVSA
jgi:hypothetical protein